MSIRKNLNYNPKTDAIEGYQDHGSQGRSQQIASHALVFMLVGLRKKWKQPIAHFFSGESVTADRLQVIIKEVLAECFINNLDVVATVCDIDGVNMRALNALGSTVESPYFIYKDHEIVTIMDPPHLLKCFRNNFLKHNIKCPENFGTNASGIAKWEHIKEFFEKDNNNPNFVFAPALTDQHINPNGKQKMKVKLAAQALSHSVAAGMFAKVARNEISPEAVTTATMISKIDAIFDALNADSPDLKRGKLYSTNLTKQSQHLNLFKEMKYFFQNIKFIGARSTPPSVFGWIRTIRAVKRLWHNLLKFKINSLATRRLNQDPLENLFGCIRGHCGSNPNPNVPQFIAGLKTSIINNLKYKCGTKNCEDDSYSLLTNMTIYLKTNTKDIMSTSTNIPHDIPDANINVSDLESEEMQACAYVCGFIFKKLKNNLCECCKKIMLSNNIEPIHVFNTFKEYSDEKHSLNYANIVFVKCVETCANIINEFLIKNSHSLEIKKTIIKRLNERLSFNWLDGCQKHKTENIDDIVNCVTAICIKRFCTIKNRTFAAEASKNALQRKIKILQYN